MTVDIRKIGAVDVHAHYGLCTDSAYEINNKFMSGDIKWVDYNAQKAGVKCTIVSPLEALMPRGRSNPEEANALSMKLIEETANFLFWVVIDPRKKETFDQAERMLKLQHCAGIKIHPEEHEYHILEYGDIIFEFAASHNAVIISHSGEEKCKPEDFIRFADKYPNVRLIVSHLGCGYDGDIGHQVRAIKNCRNGNIYTDTSSSQSIMPNLIEWAVNEIGADRILFGTDSPLYFAAMQRARIDYADISAEDKKKILYGNALKLFDNKRLEDLLK